MLLIGCFYHLNINLQRKKKTDLHDKMNQLLAIRDMMTEDKNKLRGEIELLEMYTNCLNVFRSSLAENLLFSSH